MTATPNISLDKSFSCTDEKKRPALVTQHKKKLARCRCLLKMRTLGDVLCRACHSLELSSRPDGLVVHRARKGEAVGHTEDIDVIVVAVRVLGWLTKRGGREGRRALQRKQEG